MAGVTDNNHSKAAAEEMAAEMEMACNDGGNGKSGDGGVLA
jgi:hypothetical protein